MKKSLKLFAITYLSDKLSFKFKMIRECLLFLSLPKASLIIPLVFSNQIYFFQITDVSTIFC